MTLAKVYSRSQLGIDAPLVQVEVHIANGLPALSIVGLPEAAVKESKDRVRAALSNSHFDFPLGHITINLAPADLPKQGGRFDLPIAVGVLVASGQLTQQSVERYEFIGELALNGELRAVPGALPVAIQARNAGRALVCAQANGDECALVNDVRLYAADSLLQVCAHLEGVTPMREHTLPDWSEQANACADLSDIHGQARAKRALEIAAAGGHSLLLYGPPGTGKTMLATRLPGLLPLMSEQEAIESAALHSISAQGFSPHAWRQRRFCAPHHTASAVAMVGGGSVPRPGEISMAHNGVLFLDELAEYDRKVLEVLREPLESGRVRISRAARHMEYPADFQLIAAMNPCPCGYYGHSNGRCQCSPQQIQQYRNKLSGPILDRIDMYVELPNQYYALSATQQLSANGESSALVRERVVASRERQLRRAGVINSRLSSRQTNEYCRLGEPQLTLLEQARQKMGLSMRAVQRILRVARSIADLAEHAHITSEHLSEALSFRQCF